MRNHAGVYKEVISGLCSVQEKDVNSAVKSKVSLRRVPVELSILRSDARRGRGKVVRAG